MYVVGNVELSWSWGKGNGKEKGREYGTNPAHPG